MFLKGFVYVFIARISIHYKTTEAEYWYAKVCNTDYK